MNRRSPRILLSLFLLTALLTGSCSEEEGPIGNQPPDNHPPVIQSLMADRDSVYIPALGVFNGTITLVCETTDEDYDPLELRWSCSRGSFPEGTTGFSVIWLAPSVAGEYWIQVRVDDGTTVAKDSLRITVWTPEQPKGSPIARFKVYPVVGVCDTQFQLDASLSSDLETAPSLLEVRWDFEGDGIWDTEWALEKRITHQFNGAGSYPISLQVRDTAHRFSEASREVQVEFSVVDEVFVPPGEFLMGPPGEEVPEVIEHSFLLGRTEVTNSQYLEALNWAYDRGLVTVTSEYVIQNGRELLWIGQWPDWNEIRFDATLGRFILHAGGHSQEGVGPGLAFPEGYDPGLHPVKNVSWFGAICYCDWLSAISGLPLYNHGSSQNQRPQDPGYRLPSQEEWEYAARFPDQRTYPWGNEEPDCSRAEYNPGSPCTGWTSPVGSHPVGASALGLQDMAGNVWEWIDFIVQESWYNQEMDIFGEDEYSWIRGGGLQHGSSTLRCYNSTHRYVSFGFMGSRFTYYYPDTGFRVCRTVP